MLPFSQVSTNATNVCGDYSSRFNSTYTIRPTGGSTMNSSQPTQFTENTRGSNASYGRRCLICQSFSHIARFCPHNRGALVNVRSRGGRRGRVGGTTLVVIRAIEEMVVALVDFVVTEGLVLTLKELRLIFAPR